ncbi:hypothetical protein TWF506_009117 [Arthrobotrys conoides]|uniref:AMP-dependent synthetase/ligase domain-containing protein n=1 Tax=Arthrobotrys conoides TaxID=74498 RepID=A0AAN8RWU8_9PEZI
MSIGRPLLGGDYHFLSKDLRPVTGTDVGELYISGPGISPGYLDRPDLDKRLFLTLNNLADGKPLRVFKTGDLAKRREGSDLLESVGRRDNQIKLSGHRVELEVMEAFFVSTGLVSAAAGLKIQPREIETPPFFSKHCKILEVLSLKSIEQARLNVKENYDVKHNDLSTVDKLKYIWPEILSILLDKIQPSDKFFSIGVHRSILRA